MPGTGGDGSKQVGDFPIAIAIVIWIRNGIGSNALLQPGGNNFLNEEVVAWKPGEQLTMRIVGTNLPFETADIRFTLRPEGEKTVVTLAPE